MGEENVRKAELYFSIKTESGLKQDICLSVH